MTVNEISQAVSKLFKKYNEKDPYWLCRDMNIKIIYTPMGEKSTSCKGFFLEYKRIKTITLNSDMPKIFQKIILAHELGHAVLHRKASGLKTFHEMSIFDETSVFEKEANLFAAELLLDDDKVLEVINCDTSFFDSAAKLFVPPELLDFKFRVMKMKGFKIIKPPVEYGNKFLKNIKIPKNNDDYIC